MGPVTVGFGTSAHAAPSESATRVRIAEPVRIASFFMGSLLEGGRRARRRKRTPTLRAHAAGCLVRTCRPEIRRTASPRADRLRRGRGSEAPVSLVARHAVPAYGVLSAVAKDQLYWFGPRGFVFTSPWVVTARTVRHPAVVLLSATGRPFELELCGRTEKCDAVAIAPHTVRGLRAVDVELVSVNVEVHHPCYGIFADIPAPGVAQLDRDAFRALDPTLQRE